MSLRRRSLLKRASAFGAAGLFGSLVGERRTRAFGVVPTSAEDYMLPADRRVESVLEVFMFGGVSQYESFYLVEGHGSSDGSHWYQFANSGDVNAAADACGLGAMDLFEPFGEDAAGNVVNLGPFVAALRQRPDVLARTRIVVNSHGAAPHEVAIPLSLTGRRIGNPSLAGLGAHVQRFFSQSSSNLKAPVAFVLTPQSQLQIDLTKSSSAIGMHPGTVRPMTINAAGSDNLLQQLQREQVGDRAAAYDTLVRHNTEKFGTNRLRSPMVDGLLRSQSYLDHLASTEALRSVPSLISVLDEQLFTPLPTAHCGVQSENNETALNLRLASHLLNNETERARYVCVVDGGLVPVNSAAGGYDTHDNTPVVQAENLTSMLSALMSHVNAPGENDPSKIDLDKTMVVLNTEFGRTPGTSGTLGRGHWPGGYPALYIGGPIRQENQGVAGAIGPDAMALAGAGPAAGRIALLMALGIWPFEQESFNVSDVALLNTAYPINEFEAATTIKDFFFGV